MKRTPNAALWLPVIMAVTFILGFLAGDIVNHESGPTPTQK